jgi:hypothetical protein
MLRRGAAVTAGIWTVPLVQSFTNPVGATGSAPAGSGATDCRQQTFTQTAGGEPLVFEPNRQKFFDVDLNATFADITTITARLYWSAAAPYDPSVHNALVSFYWDGGDGANGGHFANSFGNPVVVNFAPGPGMGFDQFRTELLDGRARAALLNNGGTSSFTLTSVQFEVCGTPA